MVNMSKVKAFDTERKYGLELEMEFSCREDKETTIAELHENFRCQGEGTEYYHTQRDARDWHLKSDATLGEYGMEIASPALKGPEGLEELKRVLSIVVDYGASISRSCGLHVHHDCTQLSDKAFINVYQYYRRCQQGINCFVSASRRVNDPSSGGHPFSGPINDKLYLDSYEAMKNQLVNNGDRNVVNFRSYPLRGTIEFRQHQGSLEYKKIVNWLIFTQSIISWAEWSGTDPMTVPKAEDPLLPLALLKWYDFDISDEQRSARNYFLQRAKYFFPDTKFTALPGGIASELGLPTDEPIEPQGSFTLDPLGHLVVAET